MLSIQYDNVLLKYSSLTFIFFYYSLDLTSKAYLFRVFFNDLIRILLVISHIKYCIMFFFSLQLGKTAITPVLGFIHNYDISSLKVNPSEVPVCYDAF